MVVSTAGVGHGGPVEWGAWTGRADVSIPAEKAEGAALSSFVMSMLDDVSYNSL